MLPIVAIIGRPNVGKSTLFNRLVGARQAITADLAGTTRDRLYSKCSWRDSEFILIDTAGIEDTRIKESAYSKINSDVQEQVELAIEEADLILFIVDAQIGTTNEDIFAVSKIKKSKKPFILVANKFDNNKFLSNVSEFYKLGVEEIIPISAISGRSSGDLLDAITNKLSKIKPLPILEQKNIKVSGINVAIAGRPNVGKSSLFNAITGSSTAVVSEIPGTTRDTKTTTLTTDKGIINFIDTAGIRKKGMVGKTTGKEKKKTGQIEKYSVLRSFKAIESSDIVLILIDAYEGITAQDLHIAGFALEQSKGIVLVINKWDIVNEEEKDMSKYLGYIKKEVTFLPFAPVLFVSAKTRKNIDKITNLIFEVWNNRQKHISTGELNSVLGDEILKNAPKAKKNILPKINYITQAEVNPPTFIFFTSHPELIHFSYKRFLENRIREKWGFEGTPINIIFKRKNIDRKKDK